MSVNPFGYKKMSSRIYFQGTLEDAVQVDKYNANKVYEEGQLCTTLIEYYEKGSKITQYIKMRCIADETTGNWKGQAERTEVGTAWTVEDFHHVTKGLTINTVKFTRTLTLTGTASELVRFPLITNLELNPGTYYFSGIKGQSATTFHFEYDDYNSLESTTFTLNSSTKKTFYLVVEPNHSHVLTIIKPRLWTYAGNDWEYEWNPYDWEKVKGVSGYNVKKQYKKGNEAIHNYKLYKCNTDTPKTGELFNPEHWDPVMQSTKEWMDHVDICYGNAKTKYKAMYLKTNACLGKYSMTNGTTTKNGLTIDIQNRGAKIVLNGTPTADITLDICYATLNKKHVYYMSGLSSSGKNTQFFKWGDFKSYEKSTKAWPKSGRDENNRLQLVIKKQSPKSSGKPTYENYEINPEMNDTACYDSNCNGIIWKRWSTDLDGNETVEMRPVKRMYIWFNGSNTSTNYGRWYKLYEMFGWGDSYGNIVDTYMTNYTANSMEMRNITNGFHQILLASFSFGERGVYISKDGISWNRIHDTVSTSPGYGGRRAARGTWYWQQIMSASGDGLFLATISGDYHIITYVHLSHDDTTDYQIECFNEKTGVDGSITFIYPNGYSLGHYFMHISSSYYAFNIVNSYNNGKRIFLDDFHLFVTKYRNGDISLPDEGTFYYQLWEHEIAKVDHEIWDSLYFQTNKVKTICNGCFDGVLIFNVLINDDFSTTRYWTDPITKKEYSESYYDSWNSHLIVKIEVNGNITISDSSDTLFDIFTDLDPNGAYYNDLIYKDFNYSNDYYRIYGGYIQKYPNSTRSTLVRDFKIYKTDDGIKFTLVSSPGPNKSWTLFRNDLNESAAYWNFPNLNIIRLNAWGDNSSVIDRDSYDANLTIFALQSSLDDIKIGDILITLTIDDFGRFINDMPTGILNGSLYASTPIYWRDLSPATAGSYRGATVEAVIHFTGPDLLTATDFSL